MAESKIQTSFAAGEVSKNLYARVDLDKFTVGAALLRNFFVDWRGGASNRGGTKYVNFCKSTGARLMPFEFSTDITYVMEFGGGYIRFHTSGKPVVEPGLFVQAMTNANPGVFTVPLHNYAVGDEIVLSMPGMIDLDTRQVLVGNVIDASHVSFTDMFGNPLDTTLMGTYPGNGNTSRVYTLASPYKIADVFDLNFTQSADVVTIVHPLYTPMNLSRVGNSIFTLTPDVPGAVIQPPTALTATPNNVGNKHVYGYVVTALSQDGKEESIMSAPAICKSGLLDQTASPQIAINLAWVAPANQIVSGYKIYKWGPVDAATGVPPTIFGYIGETQATSFQDNNIAADFSTVPEQFTDPFSPGQLANIAVTAPGSYTAGGAVAYVPLTITGNGTGASGYAVIEFGAGHCVGAFIVTPGKGYTSITSITAGAGGAAFKPTLSPSDDTFPSVVSFVQQRRSFAAPIGDPQAITMSQTGNFENYDTSPVVLDSDAITLRLASGAVDYIRSMTPMSTGLVILTSGGAWLLSGGTPGAPITPSQTTATRQASHGANQLPALVKNYDVLYMQQKGNTVRDLAFNFYLQSYVGQDRSYLSQHLFTNFNFIQWCSAEEPLKMIWVVRSDGQLLTMTYVAEQEVYGWAHHDTQGLFRSICTVSEGTVDAVYVIVSRYIQPTGTCGSGWYDVIERFDDRKFDCTEDVWFLDCALSNDKDFPAFTIFNSGPISVVGGNVEVCASPLSLLDSRQGNFSLGGGPALLYLGTNTTGTNTTHSVDWTNNALYNYQNVGAQTSVSVSSQQTLATNITPGNGFPGADTALGQDGNLYSTSFAFNSPFRYNPTNETVDMINTGVNANAPCGFIVGVDVGGTQWVVETGLNSGQGGGGSAPWYAFNTGNNGFTFAGSGQFVEGNSSVAPGNAFPVEGGPPSACFILSVGAPNPWTGPSQIGITMITCFNGNPGTAFATRIGTIHGSDVVPAWTSITVNQRAIYDYTDGNIMMNVVGSDSTSRFIKVSSVDGHVIWVTNGAVNPGLEFRWSRIEFGKFTAVFSMTSGLSNNTLVVSDINTLTGAFTQRTFTGLNVGTAGAYASSDRYGQTVYQTQASGSSVWWTLGANGDGAFGNPGDIVQIGCGKIEVTSITGPNEVQGTVVTPLDNLIPGDPNGNTLPVAPGNSSVATPTKIVGKLWHLEGKTVMAVADGNVVGPFTVTNGKITLPHPATNIVVGLTYQAQLQTLYLDAPGPNMQGKRKSIPAATLRLADSRGPKVGRTFDDLVEMDDLMVTPGVTPMPLVSGDFRVNLFSDWETTGQLTVQQDYPLPLTVLGIIPEFVRGDTAN